MIKRSTGVMSIKTKKIFNIYDIGVDKMLISKREPYSKKVHLNSFLDIMVIMSLDLYVQSFLTLFDALSNLIVIRQCFLWFMIIDC